VLSLSRRLILEEGNSVYWCDPNYRTYTTVLVKRGTLKTGNIIVAGTTYGKVRRMTTADGKAVKQAGPGTPVEVTGWKDRPEAGDIVLQAKKENEAKLAVRNRTAKKEEERDHADLEALNARRAAARRDRRFEREKDMVAAENKRSGISLPGILKEDVQGPKVFRVMVKTDVSGSAEAVEEAIKHLGNSEVRVEIVSTSVGEVTEGDLSIAIAAEGTISTHLVTDKKRLFWDLTFEL
jgi:translation initiation factor IF-2